MSLSNLFLACQFIEDPTYAKDVAPIIANNCVSCHRPNGSAPFSLNSYKDVAKRAKMIAYVSRIKYMPPWPADHHYSSFINEKYLSDKDIETLQLWFKSGKKPGDTASMANSKLPLNYVSVLGKPDLIISIQPIEIKNDNKDQFYVVKIPVVLNNETYVRAVEFVPGQTQYAHHVNGHYLNFQDSKDPFKGSRIANVESSNYLEEFTELELMNNDGSLPIRVHSAVNYLPGAFGVKYPNGIGGFKMSKKGAFVANDMHFGPSRKHLFDSSQLYLYFSSTAPKRATYELMLGTNGSSKIIPPLIIKANSISKHITKLKIYSDISVLTVNPHMHLLGSQFKAFAIKPNGDSIHLIYIPKWQFRWQYFYTFKTPVKIPKGSEIIVEAIFDNTLKNPNNPFDPPQDVSERLDKGGASMRTTDEMLQFIITYMPYQSGDENIDLSKP